MDYEAWCKPKLARQLQFLKLDTEYVRALGDEMFVAGSDQPIFDFLGGFGSTILGHNNPEVVAEAIKSLQDNAVTHAQGSVRQAAAQLGEALSRVFGRAFSLVGEDPSLPEVPEFYTHLVNTGTEAVEAALKHSLMEWTSRRDNLVFRTMLAGGDASAVSKARPLVVALKGAFHGKTAGSLAVTHNPDFSWMFDPSQRLQTVWIDPSQPAALPEALVQLGPDLTNIVCVIAELVQGEGGIKPLDVDWARRLWELCREKNIPFIADEVQTGMWRLGTPLACHHYGIVPDAICLGKSLGGGLSKIGCAMFRKDRYIPEFSTVHTSTFSEDTPSCLVALKSLNVLSRDSEQIAIRAKAFQERAFALGQKIRDFHPELACLTRGIGFMCAIEIKLDESNKAMNLLVKAKVWSWIASSFLLNRHNIRVGGALSVPGTIRLEPSWKIGDEAMTRLEAGLLELAGLVAQHKLMRITEHLWERTPRVLKALDFANEPQVAPADWTPAAATKVAFVTHIISDKHLRFFEPPISVVTPSEVEQLYEHAGSVSPFVAGHEYIRGTNGASVHCEFYMVFKQSAFFKDCLVHGCSEALELVRSAVSQAIAQGASIVGLGQYTSIVSGNGLLVMDLLPKDRKVAIVTGNALTAAFAARKALKEIEAKGLDPKSLRLGVLGAAGNICSVLAEFMGTFFGSITLFHNQPLDKSPKLASALKRISAALEREASADRQKPSISVETDFSAALPLCDVLICGTNSVFPVVEAKNLKQGAIALDISVPPALAPDVFERSDVTAFQGGYAQLPLGQKFVNKELCCPPGESFCCLAETIARGLAGSQTHSIGHLSAAMLMEAESIATEVGFTVGSSKTSAAF